MTKIYFQILVLAVKRNCHNYCIKRKKNYEFIRYNSLMHKASTQDW